MGVLSFNSRIGTTVNLPQGATYDLLLTSFPDSFPQSQLVFEISNEPRKVTGVQKVAQTFLKLLFTSKGSNVLYPQQGTFMSSYIIHANKIDSDPTLILEMQDQINDAAAQTQAMLNTAGSDPASMLSSITILGLDTGTESVVIYLQMLTMAGVTASIAVPFPALDMQLSS